ncbi:MAG: hypothetical protein JO011_06545 [Ktedonobacteraceae bacterium]|nr:hypothetical protein [Ktedonobacteraceae bacterium]
MSNQAHVRKPALDHPVCLFTNQQGRIAPEQMETLLPLLESRKFPNKAPRWLSLLVGIWFALTVVGVGGASVFWMRQMAFAPVFIFLIAAAIPLFFVLLLAGLILGITNREAKAGFRRNVADGAFSFSIASVQGEISQFGKSTVETPAGVLYLWGPLLPGPYCFYYLKEDLIVLSVQFTARPPGHQGFEQARQAIQQRLCQALGFSMTDLQANQQGQLSEQQRRRISRRTAQRGLLQSVDGPLNIILHDHQESPEYFYKIGEKSWSRLFQVPGKALEAPVGGIRYRAYYLRTEKSFCNKLLSIEPLEAPWWEPKGVLPRP